MKKNYVNSCANCYVGLNKIEIWPLRYSRVHSEEHPARQTRVVLQLAATTKSNTMIFLTSAITPYHHQHDNVKTL